MQTSHDQEYHDNSECAKMLCAFFTACRDGINRFQTYTRRGWNLKKYAVRVHPRWSIYIKFSKRGQFWGAPKQNLVISFFGRQNFVVVYRISRTLLWPSTSTFLRQSEMFYILCALCWCSSFFLAATTTPTVDGNDTRIPQQIHLAATGTV